MGVRAGGKRAIAAGRDVRLTVNLPEGPAGVAAAIAVVVVGALIGLLLRRR